MRIFERKYFKTLEAAKEYKRKNKPFCAQIHHYAPNSNNKIDDINTTCYRIGLERQEGYFDEDFAQLFPYCVEYLVEENIK